MNTTVKVEGLVQVERNLRELGPNLAERALRKALQAGVDVLEHAVQERTPVETGLLKASVVTAVSISQKGNSGVAVVGFGNQGHVARLVEFGHRLVSHGKKRDRKQIGNVPPHPFMRPASIRRLPRRLRPSRM